MKKNIIGRKGALLLVFSAMLVLFLSLQSTAQYNYEERNVTTRVNITDAIPEILNVTVDQDITLNAGGERIVTCNATIRDWNGYQDLDTVNATLYYFLNQSGDPDSGNVHYTNSSCLETSNDGEFIGNYECSFSVLYYANNGTWFCNVSVNDTFGFTDSAFNDTSINALFALNVTEVIDYGDLAVTDTSPDISANITNFGNMDINVSVLGYGATEGDGYGLICDFGGNINVEHQRFSGYSVSWDDKTPLSASDQDMNITLLQATDATAPVVWETFWQLYVPPNPFGECTGTLRFTAMVP